MAAVEKDSLQHSWLQEQNTSTYAANPVRLTSMLTDDGVKAVAAGEVDFTLLDSDGALWATRHQFKNTMVTFSVGPLKELGWAFRKDDQDLQAAVQSFFAAQRADPDSALQALWTKTYGLSLTKFITLMTAIK